MIYTEAEAREKICPIMTRPMAHKDFQNKDSVSMFPADCAGPGCMAWRFVSITQISGEVRVEDPRGYCDLAGKPGGAA